MKCFLSSKQLGNVLASAKTLVSNYVDVYTITHLQLSLLACDKKQEKTEKFLFTDFISNAALLSSFHLAISLPREVKNVKKTLNGIIFLKTSFWYLKHRKKSFWCLQKAQCLWFVVLSISSIDVRWK